MIAWGTISASTAACKSFGGLIAIRFMLGFVEAAYFVSCYPIFDDFANDHGSLDVYTTFPAGIREKNLVSVLHYFIPGA